MRRIAVLSMAVMAFSLFGCSVSVRPVQMESSVSVTETWSRVSTAEGIRVIADEALSRVIISTDSIYECPARNCGAMRYVVCPVVEEVVQGFHVSSNAPKQKVAFVRYGTPRFYRIPDWYGQDMRPTVSYHTSLYGQVPGTRMLKHAPRTISDKTEMRKYLGLQCQNGGPVSVR